MEIIWTVLAGTLGGLAGKKLKIPMGAMTGALVAVIALRLIFQQGYLPSQTKVVLQILSGAMIGSRVGMKDIREIKSMWVSALVLIIGMILMNVWSATVMHQMSPVDFMTAYFASAPGGLQDMALISADYNADTVIVSVCQVCRVLYILIVFPVLYRFIYNRKLYPGEKKGVKTTISSDAGKNKQQKGKNENWLLRFMITVALAVVGGMLFKYLGVTAGALLGGLVFSAGFNIASGKAYFPGKVKTVLQILTGAFVGMQISRETIGSISGVLLPTLIMLLATTIFIYIFALVIYRTMATDFITSLLICTPGGLQEMCLMADEMDCDAPKIVVMHTVRILVVVSLCPIVLSLILPFVG